MLLVKRNQDDELYLMTLKAIAENEGHCPCQIPKTEDTICPCKYFREELCEGYCICKLYEKVRIPDED